MKKFKLFIRKIFWKGDIMAHEYIKKSDKYDVNLTISLVMLIVINVVVILVFAYLGLYHGVI